MSFVVIPPALYPPKKFLLLSLISDISDNKTVILFNIKNVAGLNREAMAGCLADTSGARSNLYIIFQSQHTNFSTQKISPSFLGKNILIYILYIIGHEIIISHAFIHRRSLIRDFIIWRLLDICMCWPNE